jgi:hypothetical protein
MDDMSERVTSWSIAPLRVVFTVVALTDGRIPPCCSHKWKYKSRIEQNCFDLWGTAALGEILSSCGGLSLMDSYATNIA